MATGMEACLVAQEEEEALGKSDQADTQGSRHALLQDTFKRCLAYSLKLPDQHSFRAAFPSLSGPVTHALYQQYKNILEQAHQLAEVRE